MIKEIYEEYRFDVVELEVLENHVHIMVSFPPSRSIGEVVTIIKSNSSRVLFREFPGLKRRLWSREMYDVYFALKIGHRMTREVIERYIKHHNERVVNKYIEMQEQEDTGQAEFEL